MPHQRLSLPRRPHALRRPVEQAATDLKLEIPHALRDRRLADMEGVGCAREASGSHHRREQAQQMQVQGHNFPLSGQIENILPNYRDQTHKSFSPQEKLVPQDEEFSAPGNGPANSVSRPAAFIPGVLLCTVVAGISAALEAAERRLFAHPYVEALVLAILLGMTVRSFWNPSERWQAGIAFSAKQLLEVAVMLLGASISFAAIAASGAALLGAIAATVIVTLGLSFGLSRMLGLSTRLSILIACGNSICGNSAIAAVAPVIGADGDDIASSISFTAILGVMMVLGLPLLIPLLQLSATQYGILAGLTVSAVPQVLAGTVT